MKYCIDYGNIKEQLSNLEEANLFLECAKINIDSAMGIFERGEVKGKAMKAAYSLLQILQKQHNDLINVSYSDYLLFKELVSNVDKFNNGEIPTEWK